MKGSRLLVSALLLMIGLSYGDRGLDDTTIEVTKRAKLQKEFTVEDGIKCRYIKHF